jgi:hypothetical protein
VSTDNDHAATVQALIDRIEARAYERGKADAERKAAMPIFAVDAYGDLKPMPPITATVTAGGLADVISEHPILRKLRLASTVWPFTAGLVDGVAVHPDPLTWEDLHAYRHEYDAAHQNDAQRPQTGQGGVAAPERAQA